VAGPGLVAGPAAVLLATHQELQLILDVGCGNGWMAARLAERSVPISQPPQQVGGEKRGPGRLVYGLDVNEQELEQGARVFHENPRLIFLFGDITGEALAAARVDLVLLAGSVQYFPDCCSRAASCTFWTAPFTAAGKPGGPQHAPQSTTAAWVVPRWPTTTTTTGSTSWSGSARCCSTTRRG